MAALGPEDVLTLIYTSGTTGPPKGVQLVHRNMMAAVKGIRDLVQFPEGARVISWLPSAHIAERAAHHYLPIVYGFEVTSCPNPREVMAYIADVRPSWFFAVPRIWEKLKSGLEAMLAGLPEEQRASAQAALAAAREKVRLEQAGRGGPRGARRRGGQGRRGAVRGAAGPPRLRPDRRRQRRRGADAGRGARVLPRDRHPRGRAVGHERDVRRGLLQPARQDQDRDRRAPDAGRRGRASPRTASCSSAATS